jgi:hypothetical protein
MIPGRPELITVRLWPSARNSPDGQSPYTCVNPLYLALDCLNNHSTHSKLIPDVGGWICGSPTEADHWSFFAWQSTGDCV